MTRLIGVNRFIMVVRINELMEYSQNHAEILDPLDENIDGLNVRELGTLSLPNREETLDYEFYVLNRELIMVRVSPLFVPENKQFVILLSKLIEYPPNCINIVNDRVIAYLNNSYERFVNRVKESTYQNIEFEDFLFDPLP